MSLPRPRKDPAKVSAVRRQAARSRWDKLDPEARRKATAPASKALKRKRMKSKRAAAGR